MNDLIAKLQHIISAQGPFDPGAPLHAAMLAHAEAPPGITPDQALQRLAGRTARSMAEATLLGLARAYWAGVRDHPAASHSPPPEIQKVTPVSATPTQVVLPDATKRPLADPSERSSILSRLAQPLPIAGVADPAALAPLRARFPWCDAATVWIERHLRIARALGVTSASLPPLLLAGPPGIGKTTYAGALAAALGRPLVTQPMAGLANAFTLTGLHPSFQAARPGLPVRAVIETGRADPVILLDELDRAAHSTQHGDPLEALLALTEPTTAAHFRDAFLDRELDLSRLSWIATANGTGSVPTALLSRLSVLPLSGPASEHLEAVLVGLRLAAATRYGVDIATIPAATDLERVSLHAALRRSPDLRVLGRRWWEMAERRLLAGQEAI